MAWSDENYQQIQPWHQNPQNVQIIQQPIPQQPTTIFQQIPPASSLSCQSVRPGHVKEDLVELMLIQNAQMHQVIMNNMTMSALSSFGYWQAPQAPEAQPVRYPVIVEAEGSEVYHHHYQPVPVPCYPACIPLFQPQAGVAHQGHSERHKSSHTPLRNRRDVPPPPPPSATGTVGPDIPTAAEYYNTTEGSL